MLDLLHRPDSAVLRSRGTWHGSGGVLAGGDDGEMGLGEIDRAGDQEIKACVQPGSLGMPADRPG